MANSSIKLQDIVDDASTFGELSPSLAVGGFSDGPALSMANDVMTAMILGGPQGQAFNWKWNRTNVKPFATITLQQDYFVPGIVNVGWLESAWASNINQQSLPKQKGLPLEVHRDLEVTYTQTGYPAKMCWLPNDQMQSGTWGAHPLGPTAASPSGEMVLGPGASGLQNPGPNVIYTNPIGALQNPINATTCITDANGNLWALTTYGTCGSTEPAWPTTPVYPTYLNPNAVATTVTDGTCVWTAINPKGQGFRLNPIPPVNGIVWLIQPVAQMRAPRFTTLAQTLEPVPDDYSSYFKQGFFAECYRRSPDAKVRAKYVQEKQLWMEALDKAVHQGDREMDDMGFYPGSNVMDTGFLSNPINPMMPYGPWSGW